jgi:hypothetical protein
MDNFSNDAERHAYNKTLTGFFASKYGQDLLKKHNASDNGIWHVQGAEDGMSGGFSRPADLGYFEGPLGYVVEFLLTTNKNFYVFHSYGTITKINPKVITSETTTKTLALAATAAALEEQLKEIQQKLKETGVDTNNLYTR